MTAKNAYTIVKLNRNNILDTLYEELASSSNSSETSATSTTSEDCQQSSLVFDLAFSAEKWNELQLSDEVRYRGSDRNSLKKTYTILKPGVWTSVIREEVFKETKLSCAISYKRCKIYKSGKYILEDGRILHELQQFVKT